MSDIFGEDRFAATEEACERALAWMARNTETLAQAIANRQHTEQWIKAVEAMQKSKWKAEPAHVQEREARASEEYRNAVEAFTEASKEEQKLRYIWQLCNTVIDCYRTAAANTRRI